MTKKCSRCNTDKPVEEFSKASANRDGLHRWCRGCCKDYWRENKVRYKKVQAKWYEENKDSQREYAAKHRAEKANYYREYNKKYRKENAASRREYNRKWREENKERYQASKKRWREGNREVINEYTAARKALRISAQTEELPRGYREKLFDFYGRKCMNPDCMFDLDEWNVLTEDHVMPLSKGGHHALYNMQVLCRRCNSRKHASHVDYRNGLIFSI